MNILILRFINLIHLIFVLFIVIVPFTNSNYLLLLHSIISPFMMLHWYLNDNTCALTLMEKFIRRKVNGDRPVNQEDCFTCRVIDPIYEFTNRYASHSTIAYGIVTFLWIISLFKLINKYRGGKISHITDLFKL